jgi:type VI secretion system protein ImpF
MARVPPLFGEEPLQPSVLDRLLDDEPTVQREPPSREAAVIRTLRESVRRDLADLLNTRRSLTVLPEALAELPTSLINYGLPDLQSLEIREDHALVRLGAVIEESIRTFEPRLQGVRVMPRATDLETRLVDRRVRFDIEAVLVVEPLRESVRFSSTLDVSRGAFDVTGEA